MDIKNNKKDFAKWLETLQQESWQLELIISGFAIFLLLGAYEPIENWSYEVEQIKYLNPSFLDNYLNLGSVLLFVTWYVLVVNLIIHVFLRGLWISTIGLRYVSGDIDFDTLNFTTKFNQFLRKKITSFDHYIEQLEKVCSIIFAFTFLVLFTFISVLFAIFFIGSIPIVLEYFGIAEDSSLTTFFQLSLTFLGLVYLLDFLSLGWLKKQKWLAKVYYPIYRLFSFITLSFLYRPLYYNLIDNKFGRKVGLLVIPYLFIVFIVSLLKIDVYDYIPTYRAQQSLNRSYYDDLRPPENVRLSASIPSKYIDNGFVELFLPYIAKRHHSPIAEICPDLKPGNTGIMLVDDATKKALDGVTTLTCLSSLYQIFINDSLRTDATYRFYTHAQRKEVGLLTILDVAYLPRGAHQLEVKSKIRLPWNQSDSLFFNNKSIIPFWKE